MVKQRIKLFVSALVLIAGSLFWLAPSASAAATCNGMAATIVGTNNGETITGTPGPDVIAALGGNDRIYGMEGDDRICGGLGDDWIYGDRYERTAPMVGSSNDRLFGNQGNDRLLGEVEFSRVAMQSGNNYLDGGDGADYLYGSLNHQYGVENLKPIIMASNTLIGGAGDDKLVGEAGLIDFGNQAWVTCLLLGGNSTLNGGPGNDLIYGDLVETRVSHGNFCGLARGWNDTITAGDGSDTIYGDMLIGKRPLPVAAPLASDHIDGGLHVDTGDAGAIQGFGLTLSVNTCINTETVANCDR